MQIQVLRTTCSRRRWLAIGLAAATSAILAPGSALASLQTTDTPKLKSVFEVASVKLSPPDGDDESYLGPYGEGRFVVRNVNFNFLLQLAFGVKLYQIANAPSWAESQNYNIEATPEGQSRLTYEQLKAPLQHLLEERFHLAVHHSSKEMQGYGLVAAKGGPKLTPSKASSVSVNVLRSGLRCQKITMEDLALILSHPAGKPVIDGSGIAGSYDVKLDYAPEGVEDSTLPSLFTAVQEQLGLKLESQRVPVKMLVVDHADRVPTEN